MYIYICWKTHTRTKRERECSWCYVWVMCIITCMCMCMRMITFVFTCMFMLCLCLCYVSPFIIGIAISTRMPQSNGRGATLTAPCGMMSSDVYSKLRQSPSMEHFRGIKHYLKHAAQGPLSAQLSYVASTPLSKLEAAMEAVKTSSVRRMLQEDNDPLMRFSPDVEMSIGSPASSLRMQSVAALQVCGLENISVSMCSVMSSFS